MFHRRGVRGLKPSATRIAVDLVRGEAGCCPSIAVAIARGSVGVPEGRSLSWEEKMSTTPFARAIRARGGHPSSAFHSKEEGEGRISLAF
uniref:Uncharacterized protein n=1 Tax=Arundo donax TaxID=35708 RepID=A0A0A8ZL35_ARUDO